MNSKTLSNIINEKAVAYIRVSTEDQNNKGFSLDVQRKDIATYIEEYNKNLNAIDKKNTLIALSPFNIYEEVKSASLPFQTSAADNLFKSLKNRPELKKLLLMAQKREFKHLIVHSRDRLTRNFDQFILINYFLTKNGVKIHYARKGENINIGDENITKFLNCILASVAELESNTLSIRVKSGNMQCVEQNLWPGGSPPLGYYLKATYPEKKSHRKTYLETSYYERNKVIEVFNLYQHGYSYKSTAIQMQNKYPEDNWTKSKVEKILKNEVYTGKIVWNRRGGRRNKHETYTPIYSQEIADLKFISSNTFQEISKLRESKHNSKDPYNYDTPFLLKDKLYCGKCGLLMETVNYKENRRVYRCTNKLPGKKRSELILHQNVVEPFILEQINNIIQDAPKDELWNKYITFKNVEITQKEQSKKCLEDKLEKIPPLISNIETLLNNVSTSLIDTPIGLCEEDDDDKENIVTRNWAFQSEFNNLLKDEKLKLKKVETIYNSQIDNITTSLKNDYFQNKEEYLTSLQKFNIDINSFDNRNKRLFINLIVDKITVYETDTTLLLDIIFNPPKMK